jgi:MOSC domain-containing protein YiiM
MEENLGKGGVAAMIGHGGLCAKIIESGDIALGDAITVLLPLEG